MNKQFANQFTHDWLEAWNHQDLEKILSFYHKDCEFSSPLISEVLKTPISELKGTEQLRDYWQRALKLVPNLSFELISILVGVNSLIITYYGAHDTSSADVFYFNADNKVIKSSSYYE